MNHKLLIIDSGKNADVTALMNNDASDLSVNFLPIPFDGHFFEENILGQYAAGNVQNSASIMITSNSWEGNLAVLYYPLIESVYGELSKFSTSPQLDSNKIISDGTTLDLMATELSIRSGWDLYKQLTPSKFSQFKITSSAGSACLLYTSDAADE